MNKLSDIVILTPEQQLIKHVEDLQHLGFDILLKTDRGYGKRAYMGVGKRGFGLEFIVKGSGVFIGLKVFKTVDYQLLQKVVSIIEHNGYIVRDPDQRNIRIETDKHVEDMQGLYALVSSLEFLEDHSGSSWKSTADLDVRIDNIVKIIKLATQTGDTTLLKRDMVDDVTPKVAINLKTDLCKYGEHVVPIDFMFQYSVKLFKQGADDDVVFDFWKRNLKVAYIKESDARILDVDLGMRTKMTEGWEDGDSPLARIEYAGIKLG